MNNELRDPLDRVSNSLRRAVSINKSKETDLRTTMKSIQQERRRSFNSWSLRQEKFLRAKQNLVPSILSDQPSQLESFPNSDAYQQIKTRKRRITFVKAVAPVTLSGDNGKSRTLSEQTTPKVPNIVEDRNIDGKKRKKSKAQVLPQVITLANSSRFFQEHNKPRRISRDHRHVFSSNLNENNYDSTKNPVKEGVRARKVSTVSSPLQRKQQSTSSITDGLSQVQSIRSETDFTKGRIGLNPMPSIEENGITSSEGINKPPGIQAHRNVSKFSNHENSPNITATEEDEGKQTAKARWKTVRDSLPKITASKKTDKSKLSMLELTKLFEEIRECRYLRVGSNSRYTDHTSHSSNICKCLACAIKDKNKLKNHLSASD